MAAREKVGSLQRAFGSFLAVGSLSDIRDILRGALASLGGFGGRMVARLCLMLIAGQLYGAAPLGLLGQVAALSEILAAIAALGLKRSLLGMLSDKTNAISPDTLIKESLAVSLALAVVMSVFLGFAFAFLFSDTAMPVLLYAVIPCTVFAEVAGTAIRFKRIIRWEVIARCVPVCYYQRWRRTSCCHT